MPKLRCGPNSNVSRLDRNACTKLVKMHRQHIRRKQILTSQVNQQRRLSRTLLQVSSYQTSQFSSSSTYRSIKYGSLGARLTGSQLTNHKRSEPEKMSELAIIRTMNCLTRTIEPETVWWGSGNVLSRNGLTWKRLEPETGAGLEQTGQSDC